jgi:hypothetical protein
MESPRFALLRSVPRNRPWPGLRAWFWAAAVYNLAWGLVIGFSPHLLLAWMGMTDAQIHAAGSLPAILASCIGMFVGVYALGYALVAIDPQRFWPFALIGLAGKVLGPIGAVVFWALGPLPPRSFMVNVFNDLIWWPAFTMLAWRAYRAEALAQ